MMFCCKLSAVGASLAVKEFCKSINVGQKKFDPHRIETPDLIEIKFGTVDYVG